MNKTAFIGLGHSHIVALAKGYYHLCAQGPQPSARFHYLYDAPFHPAFSQEGDWINPEVLSLVEKTQPAFLMLSIAGNDHNILSIARAQPPYDFILKDAPHLPLDADAEILPEAVVREVYKEKLAPTFAFLSALKAACPLPFVHMEAPPPLPRAHVLAYPEEFFQQAVKTQKISSNAFRYKMWRLQAEAYKAFCQRADIPYIEAPPQVFDQEGLLAEPYCGSDATHANEAFGALMIEKALHRMESLL